MPKNKLGICILLSTSSKLWRR